MLNDGIKIEISEDTLKKIMNIINQNQFSEYDKCFLKTLELEGVLTDDANDTGGITMYGISLKFLKDEKLDLNGDGVIDENDILKVDKEQAKLLYKLFFWNKLKCDDIKSFIIKKQLFDIGVNMGNKTAVKIMQKCLNSLGESLTIDGLIGNKTISALNEKDYKVLNNMMVNERLKRYDYLATTYPKNLKFIKGWNNRAKMFIV